MPTKSGVLMQPESKPSPYMENDCNWVVTVGKEKFYLNGKQIQVIKNADKMGMRGMVWFDKFAISIPHIQSISYEGKKNIYDKPIPDAKADIDEEGLKKLREIRERII